MLEWPLTRKYTGTVGNPIDFYIFYGNMLKIQSSKISVENGVRASKAPSQSKK